MMPKWHGIRVLFSLAFFLIAIPAQAQHIFIQACIRNYTQKPVLLQEFYGADNRITDSVSTDQNGCFIIKTGKSKPAGIYRLLFEKRQFLDLIYSGSPVDFSTETSHLLDSIQFTASAENQLYYQYLGYRALSQYRLANLRRKIPAMSPQTEYARSIQNEIQSLIRQEQDFTNSLIGRNPGSIAAKLILIDRVPEPDPLWGAEKRSAYTFEHYLDGVVFNDTTLLRTNAISAKMISYLSLVIAMNKESDSIIAGFRQASFNLLAAAESEKFMYSFVKKYLSDGFKKLGYADLSREINALPDPDCQGSMSEEKPGNVRLSVTDLRGKQFPVVRFNDGKTKGTLPQKGMKTIAMLPAPGCQWSIKMETELLEIAQSERDAGYEIYILQREDEVARKPDGDIKTIYMGSREASKLMKFRGSDSRPVIFIIDGNGIVLKEINSWINLRDKLLARQ